MQDRKISLFSAILLNMNIMIGSGILIGSGKAAAIAGNASFLGWLLVFFCFVPLVLSIIKLSQLFPGAGGIYLYAKEGLGTTAGFISAWLYLTGYTFTVAVECMALRELFATTYNHWFFNSPVLFNAALISFFVIISLASITLVSRFLNSLTIVKLLPLITLIVLIPFIINPSFTVTMHELSLVPLSLPLLIFGYFGFENCISLSSIIKDSEKNAPKAILLGFLATAAIYTLFHFGCLNLMGAENLAALSASKFAQFINLPIPYLATVLSLLIPAAAAITFFAVALGVINSNAALLYSVAQDRLILGSSMLSKTTASSRPWVILILLGIVAFCITTFLPDINVASGLCIFSVMSAFFLPIVSLWVVSKQRAMKLNMVIALVGIITACGFIAYSCYTLAPTNTERLLYSSIPLVSLALGLLLRALNKTT